MCDCLFERVVDSDAKHIQLHIPRRNGKTTLLLRLGVQFLAQGYVVWYRVPSKRSETQFYDAGLRPVPTWDIVQAIGTKGILLVDDTDCVSTHEDRGYVLKWGGRVIETLDDFPETVHMTL